MSSALSDFTLRRIVFYVVHLRCGFMFCYIVWSYALCPVSNNDKALHLLTCRDPTDLSYYAGSWYFLCVGIIVLIGLFYVIWHCVCLVLWLFPCPWTLCLPLFFMLCHVTLFRSVMFRHAMLCHVVCCLFMSCYNFVSSHVLCCAVSSHIVSYHMSLCHLMFRLFVSCCCCVIFCRIVISYHFTSCLVVSSHVVSNCRCVSWGKEP